jgi:prevent-host-death family protein
MEKTVSAAEANRHFSQLLRSVREGDSYVVTAHGRPVAKIIPITKDAVVGDKAKGALLEHLRAQRPVNAGRWTRDELYEDDPRTEHP